MGMLDIFRSKEKRSLGPAGYDPRLAPGNWNVARTQYGVSAAAVMSNSAVAVRCIDIKSSVSAATPLNVYRTLADGTKQVVGDLPLQRVLNVAFNDKTDAFAGRVFISRSLDYHGEAFCLIRRDNAGQVVALEPLIATSVGVQRTNEGRFVFNYTTPYGEAGTALQEEMLWVRLATDDGLRGVSPIRRAAAIMGLQITLTESARDFAEGGLRENTVYVSMPGKFVANKVDEVIDSITGQVTRHISRRGPVNTGGGMLIIEGGGKIENLGFSSVDTEILKSRDFGSREICLAFGVPPTYLSLTQTASYGSSAAASNALANETIHPWSRGIEAALTLQLLTPTQRRTLSIEHDLSGLTRADDAARWNAHKIAREIGAMSAEEVRAAEGLGPKDPNADYTPLNASKAPNEPLASTKS